MNKRIRQLALDAGIGFTLWDDSGREMIDNYTPEEYLEKFAELIVREFIRQNKSYAVNSTHRDFYLGWNDAITHCNESVKEYFGIEE